jgi:bacitracin transport system ATP-binding protein
MDFILKTNQLTKQYKQDVAVDRVNISIKKGDIYGFLGQNGAGKTTTLRMIMGLIKPTAGEIELFGNLLTNKNKHEIYERIGSIIEIPGFYPNLTAIENLNIHQTLMGIGKNNVIEETLETVGLLDTRNKKVKNFSLGMKQRLGIARALLHEPEILILDEPTNGLDPMGIKEVRHLILDLAKKKEITVLISSHILPEVQQLSNKIGIIHQGKLVEEIDYELLDKKNRHYTQIIVNDEKKAVFLLEEKLAIKDYQVIENGVIRIYEQLEEASHINHYLVSNGIYINELVMKRDTLEDYFMKLIGGERSA